MSIDPKSVTWDDDGVEWDSAPSFGAQLASAAVRPVANAVSALPLLAADAGVGVRNFLREKRAPRLNDFNPFAPRAGEVEMPSATFQRALDSYTLPPEGIGKAAELVSSVLVGSKLPAPQAKQLPPRGFMPPQQALRTQALQQGQKEGYVVPPSAGNPTMANRAMEGLAGKLKVGQAATIRNQPVTDKLAARALGQNPDAPLTQDALNVIRQEAHAAGYEPVRAAGEIATDADYLARITQIANSGQGAARSFPGAVQKSADDELIAALAQPKFDSGDALDMIRILRDKADDAFSAGQNAVGRKYKDAAKAIEDMIERGLEARGEPAQALLSAYRAARQRIAQTYTAGKALIDDAGQSNARRYAAELHKGKPLVGDQRKIAAFAANFGKYTPKPTGENFPTLSPIDIYGAGGVAAAADSVLPLAYPFTRTGMQQYLLSPAGQARAIPKGFVPRSTLGLLGAYPILGSELLGQ